MQDLLNNVTFEVSELAVEFWEFYSIFFAGLQAPVVHITTPARPDHPASRGIHGGLLQIRIASLWS